MSGHYFDPLCSCTSCHYLQKHPQLRRQPIAVIPLSSIDDAPQPLCQDDAITQAYEATRQTIATLETLKTIEHVGGDWSPSQWCRRAS